MNENLFQSGLGIVVAIFLVILSVLWLVLPFVIFGIHTLLKQQVKLMREAAERERIRDTQTRNQGRFGSPGM